MDKELPEFLKQVIKKYPKVWERFQDLGSEIGLLEGLDLKSQRLVKLGIAIGAKMEGAVHAHVRMCKKADVSDQEIYHAAMLAVTTIGWPSAIAATSWIEDILKVIETEHLLQFPQPNK